MPSLMKTVALFLAFLLLFGAIRTASAAEYVILISCDGTRPDAITAFGAAHTPTFHRLRKEGAFTDNARTDVDHTTTLQNHTCMITGRPVMGEAGHQWTENVNPKLGQNLHRNRNEYLASVFDVAHDHGLKTALYGSKTKFSLYDLSYDAQRGAVDRIDPDNGRDKIDVCLVSGATISLVDKLVAELKSDHPPRFTMLHLSNPDSAGHDSGWNLKSKSSEYLKSIAMVDSLIGRVLEAVESTDRLQGRTTLIVTADHGGKVGTKGHEQSKEPENFTIPFYVWGAGVSPGADLYALNGGTRRDPGKTNPGEGVPPIRNGEAGNLALQLLGLPPIPGSVLNVRQDLVIGAVPTQLTSIQTAPPVSVASVATSVLPDADRQTAPALQAVPLASGGDVEEAPRRRVFRAVPTGPSQD
jgi:hypothetical protein